MNINILLFGIAADIVGNNKFITSIPENSTISDLKNILISQFSGFDHINDFAFAINESYTSDDQVIMLNDVVAVIPPVSGG